MVTTTVLLTRIRDDPIGLVVLHRDDVQCRPEVSAISASRLSRLRGRPDTTSLFEADDRQLPLARDVRNSAAGRRETPT
jgi:hypothetical protein